MRIDFKTAVRVFAAAALAIIAGYILSAQITRALHSGEEGASVWFYDCVKHKLYSAPRTAIPPEGNAVRAVVVESAGAPGNSPRIAYLEKYGPELKKILEERRLAAVSGRPHHGPLPARSSPFFASNGLVAAADGSKWFPATSAEGRHVTSEWRQWRDSSGAPLTISTP